MSGFTKITMQALATTVGALLTLSACGGIAPSPDDGDAIGSRAQAVYAPFLDFYTYQNNQTLSRVLPSPGNYYRPVKDYLCWPTFFTASGYARVEATHQWGYVQNGQGTSQGTWKFYSTDRGSRMTCVHRDYFISSKDMYYEELKVDRTSGVSGYPCGTRSVTLPSRSRGAMVLAGWHNTFSGHYAFARAYQPPTPTGGATVSFGRCVGGWGFGGSAGVRGRRIGFAESSPRAAMLIGPNGFGSFATAGEYIVDAAGNHKRVTMARTDLAACFFTHVSGKFSNGGDYVAINREMVNGIQHWVLRANAYAGRTTSAHAICYSRFNGLF